MLTFNGPTYSVSFLTFEECHLRFAKPYCEGADSLSLYGQDAAAGHARAPEGTIEAALGHAVAYRRAERADDGSCEQRTGHLIVETLAEALAELEVLVGTPLHLLVEPLSISGTRRYPQAQHDSPTWWPISE